MRTRKGIVSRTKKNQNGAKNPQCLAKIGIVPSNVVCALKLCVVQVAQRLCGQDGEARVHEQNRRVVLVCKLCRVPAVMYKPHVDQPNLQWLNNQSRRKSTSAVRVQCEYFASRNRQGAKHRITLQKSVHHAENIT